jgi:alkylation response protein AidB-like acyl-CoA dehydrogenase
VSDVAGRAAALRAAAIGGAIDRACRLTIEHVRTRRQFGRPLIQLQAVAHTVADLVVQRDLVEAAVASAVRTAETTALDDGLGPAALAVAGRAAGLVAAGAHQLHGAMGITREHTLHLVTRRLWAWRDADGGQRWAESRVGERVLAGEADEALWALAGQPAAATA